MAGGKRPKRAKRRMESPSIPRLEEESKDGSYLQPSAASDSPAPPATLPKSFSPILMQQLCDSIAKGVGLSHAARLLGIRAKLEAWRKADQDYIDGRIAMAQSHFIAELIERIRKAGEKSWLPNAWLLERNFPSQFAAGVARGKPKESTVVSGNVIFLNSAVPRSPEVLRRRGLKIGEPNRPPDEVKAINAEILRVIDNTKEQAKKPEGETE